MKQIQHIYPLDQSYKVSLFSRCENDYIRGSGEIKQIQSISANIIFVEYSQNIFIASIVYENMFMFDVERSGHDTCYWDAGQAGELCMNGHG